MGENSDEKSKPSFFDKSSAKNTVQSAFGKKSTLETIFTWLADTFNMFTESAQEYKNSHNEARGELKRNLIDCDGTIDTNSALYLETREYLFEHSPHFVENGDNLTYDETQSLTLLKSCANNGISGIAASVLDLRKVEQDVTHNSSPEETNNRPEMTNFTDIPSPYTPAQDQNLSNSKIL